VARCIEYARRVNPGIEVLQVSATKGDGLNAWLDWLERELASTAVPAVQQPALQQPT